MNEFAVWSLGCKPFLETVPNKRSLSGGVGHQNSDNLKDLSNDLILYLDWFVRMIHSLAWGVGSNAD